MSGKIKAGLKPQTKIIVYVTGTMIIEEKRIISHFKNYFEFLLNRPIIGHDLDLNIDQRTAEIDTEIPKYDEIETIV